MRRLAIPQLITNSLAPIRSEYRAAKVLLAVGLTCVFMKIKNDLQLLQTQEIGD